MRLFSLKASLFLAIGFTAACSNKDLAPPPSSQDSGSFVDEDTGSSSSDSATTSDGEPSDSGSTGDGSSSETSSDGSSEETLASDSGSSTDGASTDSGSTMTDGGGDATVAAVCAKSYSDVTPTSVTYPGPHDGALLAAITPDELTMVWTTSGTGKVIVHYSDRASRDAAFTTDNTLPDSLGPFAEEKVGLYSDGRTMMFVSVDHKTVKQITRTARGVAFDATTATSAPFANITGSGGEGGAAKQLTDLTLSKDGKSLFYTDLLATTVSVMLSTKLSDGTWDLPTPISATRLQMDGTLRRRPTGLSSDDRTLFFFDESLGATFVAFRAPGTASFTEFYGYSPSGSRAVPAEGCSRVYLDIEVAEPVPDGGFDGDTPTHTSIYHAP